MAQIQLILSQDVPSLGGMGQIVNVKGGYARNYLIPRGFAVLANERNKSAIDSFLKRMEKKKATLLAEAKKLARSLEKVSITISKPVGEEDKIFGTVTTAEIAEVFAAEGHQVDKKNIQITEEISKVGVYQAKIKLHTDVSADIKVWVVAQ